jgi:hypothetical protein
MWVKPLWVVAQAHGFLSVDDEFCRGCGHGDGGETFNTKDGYVNTSLRFSQPDQFYNF